MDKQITVNTHSGKYNVTIGSGLDYGKLAVEVKEPCAAVIISDDNVFPLYGDKTIKSFEARGYKVSSYVIKNGEASKTFATVERILTFLSGENLTRSDMLVSLGGGVVGDITGFAAAIYLRGIKFIQLPTTVLAAVDSSVGGKTGVDLPSGKNLVGAFYQPSAVFCDIDTFATLPGAVYADGMAEVVKHCVIGDAEMLTSLDNLSPIEISARNVQIKARVVEEDEFDTGARMCLNFGHTVGHAVEMLSDFKISHGGAVAIGMVIVTRAAEKLGLVSEPFLGVLTDALEKLGLPTGCEFNAKDLARVALIDKKRMGGTISLIVPEKIGKVKIHPIPVTELEDFINGGLE